MKVGELKDLWQFNSSALSPQTHDSILVGTGRNGRIVARDYVHANAVLSAYRKFSTDPLTEYTTSDNIYAVIPQAWRFRLKYYTPCLACRIDDLKQDKQDAIYSDVNWEFTEKMNGVRVWLLLTGAQFNVFSRNYSDVDCSLLDYSGNIFQTPTAPQDNILALDCEIMCDAPEVLSGELSEIGLDTEDVLSAIVALLQMLPDQALAIQRRYKEKYGSDLITFRLIAPLYMHGKNYVIRSLGEGIDVYDEAVRYARSLGLNVKPIKRCIGTKSDKELFVNSTIDAGGEGIVAHNRSGAYCTSENRSDTSYVKIKRRVGSTEGISDSIDAFITGIVPGTTGTAMEGMVAAFQFSSYILDENGQRLHHIATISGIDRETLKKATIADSSGLYTESYVGSDGEAHHVSLNPEFDALVAEISGQALSSRSQRLEHARLLRWRFDKEPYECTYTQQFLDKNTTGKGISYLSSEV